MNWVKPSVAAHHQQANALTLDHDIWDTHWSGFCLPLPGSNSMHHELQKRLVVLHISLLLLICVYIHRTPCFLNSWLPPPTQPNPTDALGCKSYNTCLDSRYHSLFIVMICFCICFTLSSLVYVLHMCYYSCLHPHLGYCRTYYQWTNEPINRHALKLK